MGAFLPSERRRRPVFEETGAQSIVPEDAKPGTAPEDRRTVERLQDEVEQLRTALEAAEEERTRLAEDRERLLRRLAAQSRDLQAADAAYREAGGNPHRLGESEEEELRIAFEEMQVLTEELEVANNSLQDANRALDQRVAERTEEIQHKNDALAESELRFRTLVEGMPQLVWRATDGGFWTWASPQWERYTGLGTLGSSGMGWLAALHPDDRAAARLAWAAATPEAPLTFHARIYQQAEDRYRHFHIRAAAVMTADGRVAEWLGTSTDVDDLLRLQERQRILVAELQHRVRNILTVVRSVFGRTMEAGGSADELADHFRGRLDSLARTQVIVTQSAAGTVDLENLVRDELLSVGAMDGPSLEIEGPGVALTGKTAESIGLAIHELTTNALKYGALRAKDGNLQIRWSVNMDDGGTRRLDLRWIEQGVPAITLNPVRKGFGTELITDALPYQLGADTRLEFRGGGVRCSISVPLPEEGAFAVPKWKDR